MKKKKNLFFHTNIKQV